MYIYVFICVYVYIYICQVARVIAVQSDKAMACTKRNQRHIFKYNIHIDMYIDIYPYIDTCIYIYAYMYI